MPRWADIEPSRTPSRQFQIPELAAKERKNHKDRFFVFSCGLFRLVAASAAVGNRREVEPAGGVRSGHARRVHPGYVRAFMDHYAELEDTQREEMRDRRREYFTRITDIFRAGMEKGEFRQIDVDLATLAFVGMCNWAYKWYPRMAAKNPPEKMAKSLCDIFLGGVLRK
jgi:hypothetical protein